MKKPRVVDWEDCEFCGGELTTLTDENLEPGHHYDGDDVTCENCGKIGCMNADGESANVIYE